MEIVGPLLIIAVLILANGIFVAAEFAILGAPRQRIEKRAAAGDRWARRVLEVLQHPQRQDIYIATAQLGITVASVALGMYGEHTIAGWLLPPLEHLGLGEAAAHTTATVITVVLVTYLHVVLGEMIPKSLALTSAERTAVGIMPLMALFRTLSYPIVWVLNSLGNWLMHILGVPVSEVHGKLYTVEELEIVVEESSEGGLLGEEYADLFRNLLDLPDRRLHQIMEPRTDIVGIPLDLPAAELLPFIDRAGHTRYPVYDGDLDHIVGVLHVKDVFRRYIENPADLRVETLMQQPLFVPDSASATWLLDRMRERRMHLAIVLDEFGGTAGVVTFEDVLEQVVGEVRDEFDVEEAEPIVAEADGAYRVQGDVLLEKLNEELELELPAEEIDTVGGLVLGHLGRPAELGDVVDIAGVRLEVTALRGRGVAQVRLVPVRPSVEEPLAADQEAAAGSPATEEDRV
jgi:CBS domain containing-hemolysin-like protein